MAHHNTYNAESLLNTLMHQRRWDQALVTIDDWLRREPGHTELLLRKVQLLHTMGRYEQGLTEVRLYRALKPEEVDIVFLEVSCLLEMGRTTDAAHLLEALPATQPKTPRSLHYHGRILLTKDEWLAGLLQLWDAYVREPGYNRALLEWAALAVQYYGKGWVRRQLTHLLAQQQNPPTVAASVGLALNLIEPHRGHSLLQWALEQYTLLKPLFSKRRSQKSVGAEIDSPQQASEIYRQASEQLWAGQYDEGLATYYKAVSVDPSWVPVFAPLLADVLLDELMRPEEARVLLEDALRREPMDYRLHFSYTKVFLQLRYGEEALSSASCSLALAPEEEKAMALVQRASAHLLLRERNLASQDLQNAIAHQPEVKQLIRQEPTLHILLQDHRFRETIMEHSFWRNLWETIRHWLLW